MTVAVPLSEAIRQAVERCFPPEDRQPALTALASVQSEAVREAIVILAYGDQTRLESLVKLEKTDDVAVLWELDERWSGFKTVELIRRCRELGLSVPWPWSETLPEKIEADVKRFVAEELIIPFERIQTSMWLQEDLGVAGPEGAKFMAAFGRRFDVDLSEFNSEAHFGKEEGIGLVSTFLRLLRKPKQLLPITVQDLVGAVQTKKLATPVGNAG